MAGGPAITIPLPAPGVAVSQRREGRDHEVEVLYQEHFSGLCRLATLLLGDAAAAEEAVQEAFVHTYAGWWRLRRPERAQWYLRSAVVNQCRSRMRRRITEDRGNRAVWAADGHGGTAGAPAADADGTDAADQAREVLEAVRALPERQREAVILRYYADLTDAQVAAALGCSTGTVKSQLHKARAALARALATGEEAGSRGDLGRTRPGAP